jgi:hypothetical protein
MKNIVLCQKMSFNWKNTVDTYTDQKYSYIVELKNIWSQQLLSPAAADLEEI